jgi:hypothetical protein
MKQCQAAFGLLAQRLGVFIAQTPERVTEMTQHGGDRQLVELQGL